MCNILGDSGFGTDMLLCCIWSLCCDATITVRQRSSDIVTHIRILVDVSYSNNDPVFSGGCRGYAGYAAAYPMTGLHFCNF